MSAMVTVLGGGKCTRVNALGRGKCPRFADDTGDAAGRYPSGGAHHMH